MNCLRRILRSSCVAGIVAACAILMANPPRAHGALFSVNLFSYSQNTFSGGGLFSGVPGASALAGLGGLGGLPLGGLGSMTGISGLPLGGLGGIPGLSGYGMGGYGGYSGGGCCG